MMLRRSILAVLTSALALPWAMADRAERAERVNAAMSGKVVQARFTDSARAAVRSYAAARGKQGLRRAEASWCSVACGNRCSVGSDG